MSLFVFSMLVAPASALHAQDRFELLSRDPIAQMPDVTIDTIHDKRTATCFAMFSGLQRVPAAPPVGTAGRAAPRVVDVLPAAPAPGAQTGGLEPLAESVRRALVDPATARALSAPLHDALVSLDDRLRRLETLLEQIAATRTVAVWPVPCELNR